MRNDNSMAVLFGIITFGLLLIGAVSPGIIR